MPRMMPPKKKMPINQSAYIIQNSMAVSADNMKLIKGGKVRRNETGGTDQHQSPVAFRHRIIT